MRILWPLFRVSRQLETKDNAGKTSCSRKQEKPEIECEAREAREKPEKQEKE
jgi:hypothetical protein